MKGDAMNAGMRPIDAVSPLSLARIGAAYYAAVGLVMLTIDAVKGTPLLSVPFGFLVPLLHLTVTFNFPRALWAPGVFSQVFFSTILYALTGSLSGFVCGVAYNLTSKYLRVRINGGAD
jgi:hypothetical protein